MSASKLHTKMNELAGDSNLIVATSTAIVKLRQQGLPFQEQPARTLDQLFDERRQKAEQILGSLPPLPDEETLPHAIRSLYEEIRECIIFGNFGAAITLCGNLIEFSMKHVTFIKESGGVSSYDANKWDEFEAIDFGTAIGRAKKAGLINSKMGKRLHAFREDIRNPYSHFNIRQITRDVIWRKVKVLNIETGDYEEKDIAAEEDPVIQAAAKPLIDAKQVLNVFWFADEVLKYLLGRLERANGSTDDGATSSSKD